MKKIVIIVIFSILIYLGSEVMYKLIYFESEEMYENEIIKEESNSVVNTLAPTQKEIDDWRLTLVNHENMLPEDYEIQLVNIDSTRQFDSRAINELNQMILDLRKDGIRNVWVQSSYRSIEYQTRLFNDSVNTYITQGKTREEAEKITLQKINKPGTSEHNLGLAVDFNYVDYSFETTNGFKWLLEKAEDYGFILRYKKEKEDITKVDNEILFDKFLKM